MPTLFFRVVIVGLAAILVGSPTSAQTPTVKAENFGVAIGGSLNHSNIIIGTPPEKLQKLNRDFNKLRVGFESHEARAILRTRSMTEAA